MSAIGAIADGIGTVASVGTKVISTVTSLGAKATGGASKLLTSKLGLAALGGLGGILLVNNIGDKDGGSVSIPKSGDGKSSGFQGFVDAAKNTISGIIGGAASLFKGLTEKVTTAANNLFGKNKDKDNDLDKAVDGASASNIVKNITSTIAGGMAGVMNDDVSNASPSAGASNAEKDAGEEYGA